MIDCILFSHPEKLKVAAVFFSLLLVNNFIALLIWPFREKRHRSEAGMAFLLGILFGRRK